MTPDAMMVEVSQRAVPNTHGPSQSTGPSTRAAVRGWVVLGLFMLVAGLSQLLWLNFAPLLTLVQTKYGVGEGTASLLLLVFPLVYVLVSVPAGRLTDQRGYPFAVGLGAVLMAVGACLRVVEGGFWLLLAAQVIISVGQPFAVNGISKLVADWFPARHSAIATGLGTMGMFLGMAVGMAATPPMVEALGYRGAMVAFAALSVAICVAFVGLARTNPDAKAPATSPVEPSMRSLLTNRPLLVLFGVAFLGLGFFNGLTTWLEPILAPNGFDAVKAGLVGGVLIVGGVFGAILVPAWSDSLQLRKPFLLGCMALSLVLLLPLTTSSSQVVVLASATALGFFFLPAFALLLDVCTTVAGEAAAGAATGLLMLFGNLGGVVVIVAMELAHGGQPTFARGVMLLFAVAGAAFTLGLWVDEPLAGRRAAAKPVSR